MGRRHRASQARFKLVFQKATFSNNNVWMRRKLMEAAGVVPIKSPRRRQGESKARPQGVAGLPPVTIGGPLTCVRLASRRRAPL